METNSPRRFEEIYDLLRIGALPGVVYTGEKKDLRREDRRAGAQLRASKTWMALSVLDRYADLRSHGQIAGGVYCFLRGDFGVDAGWPVSHFSSGESQTTQRSPKLAASRVFPVPTSVDPSGRAPMFGHFKLEQIGSKRSRMHFLDDTARSGLVYVGYIGPHLPTTDT